MNLRLKRQLMGLMSYLMFLLPLAYCVSNGWVRFSMVGLAGFTAVALLINAVFFVLIRSGWSQRQKDPSLTFPQIIMALAVALVMIRYAEEARPVLLMLFFTSFFFGVFGLTQRQFWILAIGTIVGYAVVVGSEFWAGSSDTQHFQLETLQFLVLIIVVCWMALIGGYVASLRQRVATQRVELETLVERLRTLVSYDELTGVFNRRHLLEIVEHEKAIAARHDYAFSVCLLDIDHFKKVNDEHGHAVGDEVLREFSARMRTHSRKMDWLGRSARPGSPSGNGAPESDVSFGRYGGEEFLVVMPHTPAEAARLGVERLRRMIQATPVETSAGPLEVRFSAGIAQHLVGESVDATIARADMALYEAKRLGRNRTAVAEFAALPADRLSPPVP